MPASLSFAGTFITPPVNYAVGSTPYGVAVGDFNGDGKLDIVTDSFVLLGNGDGTFQPAALTGAGGVSVAVGDFNGDGTLDLVTADCCGSTFVIVLLGNGDGTFQAATTYAYTFPAANQWYHVVMLRDSGTTKFFVDGVQTSSTHTNTPLTPTEFRIGSQDGIRFFNGLVDEVALYNRALSNTEIQALFAAGVAGKCK